MSSSLILDLYKCAAGLLAPVMPVWLQRRVRLGKEDAERWRERFGETTLPRPDGMVVWCHAASVGETTSVLPLLTALTQRGLTVVLTTGTVTSARLAADRAPAHIIHQYAPLDHTPWVERFLAHWRPKLALRVDSEIWPNTLTTLHAQRIPTLQINARMSAKAFDTWSIFPGFMKAVFETLDLVCAQSDTDRDHYQKLGAPNVAYTGNLKLAQDPLPVDAAALKKMKDAATGRPIWTAGSIHPGEDLIAGRAHLEIKAKLDSALLYVVPRHPARGPEMAANLRGLGLRVAQRSLGEPLTPTTDVYLADTMGELGLFYRAAPVCFVGKSFAVGGGQNPAEPAQLGCALVWGPDMSNFADLAAGLEAAHAAQKINSPAELGAAVHSLLSDPERIARMGDAGQRYIGRNAGALNRTLERLAPYLDRL